MTKNVSDCEYLPKALSAMREINATFPYNRYITQWKAEGKKIVGWICNYVPEELIHAAGILPIRIVGYQDLHKIDGGTTKLSTSVCSFTRSCMQIMLDGKVDFINGFIGGACCDGTRRFSESVVLENFSGLMTHSINPPFRLSSPAVSLYAKELADAKDWLERSFNVSITDEALEKSIHLYNETRRLFGRLNEMRKRSQPPIRGSEFLEVTNASFTVPKAMSTG